MAPASVGAVCAQRGFDLDRFGGTGQHTSRRSPLRISSCAASRCVVEALRVRWIIMIPASAWSYWMPVSRRIICSVRRLYSASRIACNVLCSARLGRHS